MCVVFIFKYYSLSLISDYNNRMNLENLRTYLLIITTAIALLIKHSNSSCITPLKISKLNITESSYCRTCIVNNSAHTELEHQPDNPRQLPPTRCPSFSRLQRSLHQILQNRWQHHRWNHNLRLPRHVQIFILRLQLPHLHWQKLARIRQTVIVDLYLELCVVGCVICF